MTDKQLMDAVRNDCHRSFTELYRRYKHVIFHFIVRLSEGNYAMAEDILQQTFISIWNCRKKIVIEKSVQSYLKVVAKNLFLKETAHRITQELRMSMAASGRGGANERTDIEKEIELSLLLEKIERVVSMMPPVRQHIYRLKHMDNLSQKEIAQQLGISENTVESHLKLSMKFLRDKLKDDHNDMLVNCIAIALIYYLQ